MTIAVRSDPRIAESLPDGLNILGMSIVWRYGATEKVIKRLSAETCTPAAISIMYSMFV